MDVIDAGADLVRIFEMRRKRRAVPSASARFRSRSRRHPSRHGGDDVVELGIAHMGVDLRFVAHAGRRKAGSIRPPSRDSLASPPCASGRPSRIAGSSIWMTAMPAPSRSITSSRMASAIWRQVSRRGWSSRTNDHCRIVTGPVSMPFTGLRVSATCANCDQRTVIGPLRETSPKITGGLTQREP